MAVFDNLRSFIRHGKAAEKSRQHGNGTSGGLTPNSSILSVDRSGRASVGSRPESVILGQPSVPVTAQAPNGTHLPAPIPVVTTTLQEPELTPNHAQHIPRAISPSVTETYAPTAKRIIAAENETRGRVPSLKGLENYALLEKMGDGAFSVVYKAQELATGELRAIKIVSKTDLSSSQKSSVLKEAAIMRQLDHPNIAKMHAFLETPDHYFIVLELVPGGELFHQIVRLTYFSEDLSRHVITQVAHAVRYLHEVAGVVHRDIKPENLLFCPIDVVPAESQVLRPGDDESKEPEGKFVPGIGSGGIGQIKLADFGLSKVIWNSKTMTPCGTVGYTAPEIVKDERYSKSVDMWALGCVLYTILCGFPPFYDESIETLTRKVAKGQYTFLSPWWDDISMSAKDLVSRLLTVDPEARYNIDEFFAHPWITQDGTSNSIPESNEVAAHKGTDLVDKRTFDPGMDIALKDAFDVSNAVYRMEADIVGRGPPIGGGTASTIFEEEEDDDIAMAHVENIAATLETVNIQESIGAPRLVQTAVADPVPAAPKAASEQIAARANRHASRPRERERERALRHAPNGVGLFDLHLEGATLLERRRQAKTPAPLIV